MIVMSSHGRTGVNHFILGSMAEKVVARAPCPVALIPPRFRWRLPGSLQEASVRDHFVSASPKEIE